MPRPDIRLVFVEGNIGAGKSTYLGRVLPRVRMPPGHAIIGVLEPLDAWTSISHAGRTHNLFAAFYADPRRYSALFQAHVMQTRIAAVRRAIAVRLAASDAAGNDADDLAVLWVVCERSVFTDRNVFVAALVANESMSPLEHAVYEAWWDFWHADGLVAPEPRAPFPYAQVCRADAFAVVYLATPAPECQTRMRRRDRTEETGVPETYLAQLAALHDEALGHGTRGWLGSPCLCVDAAGNFADNDACADECAKQLETFLLARLFAQDPPPQTM